MGIYSDYRLHKYDDKSITNEEHSWIENKSGYNFDDYGNALERVNAKWYNHEQDMLAMSLQFPDSMWVLFIVVEHEEYYKAYFYRGKVQSSEGRMIYDAPDLSAFGYQDITQFGITKSLHIPEDN